MEVKELESFLRYCVVTSQLALELQQKRSSLERIVQLTPTPLEINKE
jgi:hypothetical protein